MQSEITPNDHKVQAPASAKKKARFTTLKRFWRSDKLMSLFALLISMGTFITFAYQNYLIQKQQYRSVMPYLMMYPYTFYDSDGQRMTSLVLVNNGIGPAFVEDLKIIYKGKEYSTVQDFFIHGVYVNTPILCSRTEIAEGFSLPINQPISILTSNDSTAARVLAEVLQNTQIEVAYSSLYDEKWSTGIREEVTFKPIKIE